MAGDASGVGIEKQLVDVEAVPLVGAVGTVGAKAIGLTRTDAGHVSVPDAARALGQRKARFGTRLAIEQAEIHRRRIVREDREVHAVACDGRTKGGGPPGRHRIAHGVRATSS